MTSSNVDLSHHCQAFNESIIETSCLLSKYTHSSSRLSENTQIPEFQLISGFLRLSGGLHDLKNGLLIGFGMYAVFIQFFDFRVFYFEIKSIYIKNQKY